MFLKQKIRDLTIPLERYPVVGPDSTLRDAVLCLRSSHCQMETGMCTEAGPRTVLVVDQNGELQGILDFRSILKVLIPEVAGGLTQRLQALGVSVAFAEVSAASFDQSRADFRERVIRNAHIKVKDVMLKIRGTIQADADLVEALKLIFKNKITKLPVYEGDKLVGIVRETDLFLAVAAILQN